MRTPIAAFLAMFVVSMSLSAVAGEPTKGPLDGMSFAGETGEKGKATGDKEKFVFKDAYFDPEGCHQFGFASTPYNGKAEGKKISFSAEHANAKGDRMKWIGTIEGDAMEGTMVYFEGKKPPKDYWFKAKRIKP